MSSEEPKSRLLGRLRIAVNKLRFLLRSLKAAAASSHSWRVISLICSSTAALRPRPLSLTDRRPPSGLIDICPEDEDDEQARAADPSSPGRLLQRTASSWWVEQEGDADVDNKAGIFIENMYRQLRMERQVSLELRYIRGYSSSSSSSSSSLVSPISSNLSVTSP